MTYILLIIALIWGFSSNITTGVLISLMALGFLIYKAMPAIYAIKANSLYNSGDIDGAKKYYQKAIDTGRANSHVIVRYVMILMRNGNFKTALRLIDKTVSGRYVRDEDKLLLKQYRCLLYHKLGDVEEAMDDALEIFSSVKNTTSYSLLGYLKLAQEEIGESTLRLCLEGYDYNSDDRDIVDNLVYAYYRMGYLEEAEELLPELIEKNPNFVEGYYHGALVKLALGKKKEAKELFEKISECNKTALTTVSDEEISELGEKLKGN